MLARPSRTRLSASRYEAHRMSRLLSRASISVEFGRSLARSLSRGCIMFRIVGVRRRSPLRSVRLSAAARGAREIYPAKASAPRAVGGSPFSRTGPWDGTVKLIPVRRARVSRRDGGRWGAVLGWRWRRDSSGSAGNKGGSVRVHVMWAEARSARWRTY